MLRLMRGRVRLHRKKNLSAASTSCVGCGPVPALSVADSMLWFSKGNPDGSRLSQTIVL
jgi:hypothetical protein